MTTKRTLPATAPDVSDILKEPAKSDSDLFLDSVNALVDERLVQEREKLEAEREAEKQSAKLENGKPADEIGLSDTWLEANKSDYLFNSDTSHWLKFDTGFWKSDVHAAESSIESVIKRQCSSSGLRRRFANHKTIRGSLGIARNHISAKSDEFNANPNLLGMPGGTVLELDATTERKALPEDRLTLHTAVKPNLKKSPVKWFAFLDEAMNGDKQMIKFLQASCRYMLTGEITTPYVWIITGVSGTGKSVFTNTIARVMGDYAVTLSDRAFSGRDEHSTVIAAIEHKRMALSSEVKGKLKSALVKAISGGDRISARRMRQDAREFQPQCKLVFTCNGLPSVDVDSAMRRRLLIVPFDHKPDDKDVNVNLMRELKAEHGAILEWMIEGSEIVIPESVRSLSDEFMDSQDLIKQFIDTRCYFGADEWVSVIALFTAYQAYCKERNKSAGSKISFGKEVEQMPDIRKERTGKAWNWIGLQLKS